MVRSGQPPIRMLNIAKCYRRESDATHFPQFHQFETLVIDKGINITEHNQLRNAIDRSFANPGEFHENRIKHLKEINPNLDGKISERVFETLNDIKRNNKLPKKGSH